MIQLIGYSLYGNAGSISPNKLGLAFYDDAREWFYLDLATGRFEKANFNSGIFLAETN